MRNSGKGGMQTGGLQYSIICPVCGKPAARKDIIADGAKFLHFTKKGHLWHISRATNGGDSK